MTTTKERITSAALAAKLRERAAEYEEAGQARVLAEGALLAAYKAFERAEYRLDRAVGEWEDRVGTRAILWRGEGDAAHLARGDADGYPRACLCGVPCVGGYFEFNSRKVSCPACLAALDEVQP
jgi:hypothetical protein